MRSLTIEARRIESARGLCDALRKFQPELTEHSAGGYLVRVEFGESDREVLTVLDVIQDHVATRGGGPARLSLDGHSYTMHPQ